MGLDTNIYKVVGYALPLYILEDFYEEYKKENRDYEDIKIHEFIEDIELPDGISLQVQSDDPAYGCYIDDPHLFLVIKEEEVGVDIFSINGNPPDDPLINDAGEKLFYDYETGEAEYILDDNECGYGFGAPEILNLSDYGFSTPKEDTDIRIALKDAVSKYCIDLDEFGYSTFLFSYYF